MPYAKGDPRQKEVSRRHYLKHKAEYFARNNARRKKMRDWTSEVKAATPCVDCRNYFPPYVMDFDHREGVRKTAIVSRLVANQSWTRLHAEIAKCDIVCSNCHRMRTYRRLLASGARLPYMDAAPGTA